MNLNFGKENFFREYNESNQLKKIMLLYIASKLEENEILDLKTLFKYNGDEEDGTFLMCFSDFRQIFNKLYNHLYHLRK